MKDVTQINISEYDYHLPDHRIARYPLEKREQSKLLLLRKGKLSTDNFLNIGKFLPKNSILVWNETRVISARLQFVKEGGAKIELFCLEPDVVNCDLQMAFGSSSPVEWKCLVGNSKRWKSGSLKMIVQIEGKTVHLEAVRKVQIGDHSVIRFSWNDSEVHFSQILEAAGEVPLPPYLHRKAEPLDKMRYQTVFARYEGSVAAPTAGLHFTPEVISSLSDSGVHFEKVTLHVGAGTFKPVSAEQIGDHEMHAERIVVSRETICNLAKNADRKVIAVGTTSMRTLESLYWIGLMLHLHPDPKEIYLSQWFPYDISLENHLDYHDALMLIIDYLDRNKLHSLSASTALMIAPGYDFKIVNGLITNFHQPKSTLLLLVSALIGAQWKEAYNYALENDFRFLSYGDSCFFMPE
ncbi:MAG: S-adenosylmethionine:tRNA ribosyltransferase-isomerase [Bacteroidales bacterium]|nr:S-adenosylmethionine:tRNA ribosyltransferase-isomerase [Bacteroidales bacterium]